jgi:uncharacterized membrane protein
MMTVAIFAVLIGLMMIGVPIAVSMGLTAAIFFVMYTGFVYAWDRWLWRRKQRKQQAAGK